MTKNFKIHEFDCKDGTRVPLKFQGNVRELAINLEALRREVQSGIIIVSGYRTASHNNKVKGRSDSQHLIGKAADIRILNKTPEEVASIIENLIERKRMKEGGIGIYKNFVHYDIRGVKARW